MISQLDWDLIEKRVAAEQQLHGFKTKSQALLGTVLQQMFPDIGDGLQETIVDGGNDNGIDAIHILERDETAEIFLFQAKHRPKRDGTTKTINDNEILKIEAFVSSLFEKDERLVKTGNIRLTEAVKRLWRIHHAGKVCRYYVYLCSNDSGRSKSARELCKAFESRYGQVTFRDYGPHDLVSAISSEAKISESASLAVLGKEILERSDGDVRGVIASVSARSFIEAITTRGGNQIKRHIFDDNLRVFLGSQGGFNKDIFETALSADSYLFWYLNNGITITSKKFSYNKGHANPTLNLTDFQIVNGAQTSHSLFDAWREEPDRLDDVVVMVRVYETERSDIAERVAIATNSQAKINARDLRANRPIMQKLEAAFRGRGVFFERKRNMHSDQIDALRLDALRLGQVIVSWYLGEPDRARSDSDSIFERLFETVFHEHHNIEELLKIYSLYLIIDRLRSEYDENFKSAPESGEDHQYLIYGHWFILFTCKLILSKRGSTDIPTDGAARELVEEAISLVANACSQSKNVAHYQMFRSAKTKEKIYHAMSGTQLNFLAELDGTLPF